MTYATSGLFIETDPLLGLGNNVGSVEIAMLSCDDDAGLLSVN